MDDSLAAYIQQLELIAFFAGYPLVYILVQVMGSSLKATFFSQLKKRLPQAYALTGTLYLGLILKNLSEGYRLHHSFDWPANPWLGAWALLSLLMWIPFFRSKPLLSFLHSLLFFFLFARDMYLYAFAHGDGERMKTDMNLYTDSLLINAACLLAVYLFYALWQRFFVRKPNSPGR